MLDFFTSIGLKQGDRYAQFFLPMVLHRALKNPVISANLENIIRRSGLTSLLGSPVIIKLRKNSQNQK